jgi:hypothetical protein
VVAFDSASRPGQDSVGEIRDAETAQIAINSALTDTSVFKQFTHITLSTCWAVPEYGGLNHTTSSRVELILHSGWCGSL